MLAAQHTLESHTCSTATRMTFLMRFRGFGKLSFAMVVLSHEFPSTSLVALPG